MLLHHTHQRVYLMTVFLYNTEKYFFYCISLYEGFVIAAFVQKFKSKFMAVLLLSTEICEQVLLYAGPVLLRSLPKQQFLARFCLQNRLSS